MNILPTGAAKEKRFSINFSLTPAQRNIEENAKRFTFIRAGRKFGKTKYSEWKALQWLGKPDSVHWHIAPTYKQARLISWGQFKRIIPREAVSRINDSDLVMQLKNGSELYLMGSDDKDSLRGPAPTSMTLEEAAYHKDDVWHEVLEPNLSVHKGPALFISTPKGFNWFKDLEDQAKGSPLWATFHHSIYDNPYIDREEIERIKKTTDPRVWSQEYMANYESSVGRVFYLFQDSSDHVRKVVVPPNAHVGRAIDWGMRDDTACLWGFVQNRALHIFREHAENSLGASDQARIIIAKSNETVRSNIISHDAARQDSEMRGLTVEWHFMNAGIRPLRKSSRDKSASRSRITELFQEKRILIDPECRQLRKQLLQYEWKDTVMEKTSDGNDDLVDALHYLVELFQYDLFLSVDRERQKPLSEIYAEIRKEKQEMQTRRYSMNAEPKEFEFDVAGTQAGYL